jgi:hypothetical protein
MSCAQDKKAHASTTDADDEAKETKESEEKAEADTDDQPTS